MSEVSIITNDEIMEMTQLVFDRYYTELKRQLRRGDIPAEKAEAYCTEILFKVYQALQEQGVAATSYEMDACAIPIINEEIRKILVPLHLTGYRNLREHPVTEPQSETAANLGAERVVENVPTEEKQADEPENKEIAPDKEENVPVMSNGEVQVYQDSAENQLNPELSMEIRRILQQEFQLESAQVKPVVVVVNVTAPQAAQQATEPQMTTVQATACAEAENTRAGESDIAAAEQIKNDEPAHRTEQATDNTIQTVPEHTGNVEAVVYEELVRKEETVFEEVIQKEALQVEEEQIPMGIIRTEKVQTVSAETAVTAEAVEAEPLPELDFDIEKMIQESGEEPETKKESSHLGLWVPIIILLMILLWLTIGMLMSYEIVPEFNLGYEWFNETLFELF